MSILNCDTRLTIINCTGLPATFTFVPEGGTMRLQPTGSCHINADIHTSATTLTEWFQEWIQLRIEIRFQFELQRLSIKELQQMQE